MNDDLISTLDQDFICILLVDGVNFRAAKRSNIGMLKACAVWHFNKMNKTADPVDNYYDLLRVSASYTIQLIGIVKPITEEI